MFGGNTSDHQRLQGPKSSDVDTGCLVYVNLVKTEEGMRDLIKHLKLITSSEIGKVRLVVTTFLDTTAYISLHFFVSVSESVSH